jgi:hypothetical protein
LKNIGLGNILVHLPARGGKGQAAESPALTKVSGLSGASVFDLMQHGY